MSNKNKWPAWYFQGHYYYYNYGYYDYDYYYYYYCGFVLVVVFFFLSGRRGVVKVKCSGRTDGMGWDGWMDGLID